MTITSQFLPIKDLYKQTKKNFSPGTITVIPDVNGKESMILSLPSTCSQLKRITKDHMDCKHISKNCLFIGNLIGEGVQSKELVYLAMKQNWNVLRGTIEDTIVRLLDACEEGSSSKMHLYASIFHANHGTRILLNFSGDRIKEVTKVARGKITHLGFFLPAVSDGILTPEEVGNVMAAALGVDVINWMRSLPIAAIFPDSNDISTVREVTIVSYGGLSSEIRQDICYSTEKIAVWGAASPARSSSKNILYHLFPKNLKPDFISQREQMNYRGSSSDYVKSEQYSLSPGQTGDSVSIKQITSKHLRKQEFEKGTYRFAWMKKSD